MLLGERRGAKHQIFIIHPATNYHTV
jgi:hypothetical protein